MASYFYNKKNIKYAEKSDMPNENKVKCCVCGKTVRNIYFHITSHHIDSTDVTNKMKYKDLVKQSKFSYFRCN